VITKVQPVSGVSRFEPMPVSKPLFTK